MASNSKNIAELLNGDVTIEAVDIATGAVTGAKLSNNFNYDSGTLYLDSTNNRVGIGTTSGVAKLEIKNTVSSTGSMTDSALHLTTDAVTGRKLNIGFGLGGGVANTNAAVIGFDVTSGTGATEGDLFFSTRSGTSDSVPTERMRIDSSGHVGIGTSSPSSFNGGANNLVVGTGSGSEGITIYADNSSNSAIFFADTDSTTTGQVNYQHASNAFTFHTNGGTERMRIDSNGQVGISTNNPAEKLSVNGNIRLQSGTNPTRIQYYNSTGNYNLGVSGGAAIAFHDTAGSQEIAFETHYTGNYHREVMRLDKFGNHTVPHQPAFWAYLSGNWTGWTPNNQTQVVPFNAEYHDIGGNFNTSNGLFTCPVAGEYIFTVGVYVGVTSVEQIWLVKAGGRSITVGFPNNGTTGDRVVGSVVIRCSANDTIGVCPYANSGTTSTVFANFHHTFFLGALIN